MCEESMPHTQENKHAVETVSEEVQTLSLLDKDFKKAILNIFKELKEAISK